MHFCITRIVLWLLCLSATTSFLSAQQAMVTPSQSQNRTLLEAPQLVVQTGHSAPIRSVLWGPEQDWISTLGDDDSIRLWNPDSGHQLRAGTLKSLSRAFTSDDGRWIVTATKEALNVWDVKQWQLRIALPIDGSYPLAFSHDSKWLVIGSFRPDIVVLDSNTWHMMPTIHPEDGAIATSAAARNDGTVFLALQKVTCNFTSVALCERSHSRIVVLDPPSQDLKLFANAPPNETFKELSIARTGSLFALTYSSKILEYNIETGELQRSISTTIPPDDSLRFAVAPDAQFAFVFGFQGWRLQDLVTENRSVSRCENSKACWDVSAMAFGSNGELALALNADLAIATSASTMSLARKFGGVVDTVSDLSFSSDGRWLSLALSDSAFRESPRLDDFADRNHSAVRLWGLRDDNVYRVRTHGSGSSLAQFRDDTDELVFIDNNELSETSPRQEVSTLFKADWLWIGSGDSRGRSFALSDIGKGIQVVNAKSRGVVSFTVPASPEEFGGVAVSDRYCAVAVPSNVESYSIELHEISTGRLAAKLSIYDREVVHRAGSVHMAFSTDNAFLFVGWSGGVARWRISPLGGGHIVEMADQDIEFLDRNIAPTALTVSQSGRLLAYGESSINIVDLGKRGALSRFAMEGDEIKVLRFSPDERWIVSGGASGVKLWEVANGRLRATLIPIRESSNWLVVAPDGLFDGTVEAMRQVSWRVGGSGDMLSLDAFFNDYYYPGLLSEIMAGGNPRASVDIATMVQVPGLRTMLTQKQAHLENHEGQIVVCFEQSPGAVVNLDPTDQRIFFPPVNGYGPGTTPTCKFEKALPTNGRDPATLMQQLQNQKPESISTLWDGRLSSTRHSTLHVVTVGVSLYPTESDFPRLPYAVPSARAIEGFFRVQQASPKKPYGTVRVWDGLYDSDATREKLGQRLSALVKEVGEDDVVLLYLAGHGKVPAGEEMFYFVPIDGRNADLPETAVSTAALADALRKLPARRIVLIVDACQSGGAVEALSKVGVVKARVEQERTQQERNAFGRGLGMHLIAATLPLSYAVNLNERESVLAETLLKALRQKIGTITVGQVSAYIRDQLPARSEEVTHFRQVPFTASIGLDFPIATRTRKALTPDLAPFARPRK